MKTDNEIHTIYTKIRFEVPVFQICNYSSFKNSAWQITLLLYTATYRQLVHFKLILDFHFNLSLNKLIHF